MSKMEAVLHGNILICMTIGQMQAFISSHQIIVTLSYLYIPTIIGPQKLSSEHQLLKRALWWQEMKARWKLLCYVNEMSKMEAVLHGNIQIRMTIRLMQAFISFCKRAQWCFVTRRGLISRNSFIYFLQFIKHVSDSNHLRE